MSSQSMRKLTAFVGRIPWTVSSKELREYFSQFAAIRSASVVFDKETGFSKRYGFVRFTSEDEMSAVLEKQHMIDGYSVSVAGRDPGSRDRVATDPATGVQRVRNNNYGQRNGPSRQNQRQMFELKLPQKINVKDLFS